MLLHGIFAPVTTPFYPDGRIYFRKLESNIDRYCRGPLAGIVVLGSTGEAIFLSTDEQREVLRIARDAAAPNKVLIAGTGAESVAATLQLSEYAAELGYDAILARTPYYYRTQMECADNMLVFYRTVADRSPLPVLIYNFPPGTAYDIPCELVCELAEHPNIIGMKESSSSLDKLRVMVAGTRHIRRSATVTEVQEAVTGRMLKAAHPSGSLGTNAELVTVASLGGKPSSSAVEVVGSLKTRQKETGFQLVVGGARSLLASLDAGATGGILAFACAAPTACFEIYVAWKERATVIAAEKQERIVQAAAKVVSELGVPGVKYAMDLNGYYGGQPRLPLLPLTADRRAEVEFLMAKINS